MQIVPWIVGKELSVQVTTSAALSTWVALLDIDPALGAGLEQAERRQATERCMAPGLALAPGPLTLEHHVLDRGGLGLYVVDGLMARRLRVGDRRSVELLGAGDVLRPPAADADTLLDARETWTVLAPAQVAVLDCLFQQRTARWPELHGALMDRALRRGDSLALRLALAQEPRLGDRIELVLWHLAERWGRVEPRGVRVPLRLSHQLIGELVCAQRPSVTRALRELAAADRVVACGNDGWLLRGCPRGLRHEPHRLPAAPVTPVTAPAGLPCATPDAA
jgi:CRP-like cAMP-binding protein